MKAVPVWSVVLAYVFVTGNVFGQDNQPPAQDSAGIAVVLNQQDSVGINQDTLDAAVEDISPLDIAGNRGLFILSSDRLLQLRILGSIRVLMDYTDQDMDDKQGFNPYEIPTSIGTETPSFFISANQTRFGIEVTRRTQNLGDIFMRLEADFKNSSNTLRIRHAYGEIGKFLVGQTWSLMNNVAFQPAIVSLLGPTGGSGLRTPQLRFTQRLSPTSSASVAIEYSQPDLNIPDSLDVDLVLAIPNFTARYVSSNERVSFRVAGIMTTIAGQLDEGDVQYKFGYGALVAGRVTVGNGDLYVSCIAGRAITHFIDMFDGKNEDMVYHRQSMDFERIDAIGGYLGYQHDLPLHLSASATLGITAFDNNDFESENRYSHGYNVVLNMFWTPAGGLRVGFEYTFGRRFDVGDTSGRAYRIASLMYYDF